MKNYIHTRATNAPLCVLMRCADHLGEVDDDWVPCLAGDEDVELVIIAVDQASMCESNDDIHQI